MRSRDSTEALALVAGEPPLPAMDFAPGDHVGDYRIERVLGKGGMGTVYAAVHRVIDKRAALKVLHPELCTEHLVVARFVDEARAINSIGHPNVVDVFGFGTLDDGRAYLAMEWLVGESLEERLERGRMPLDEIVEIVAAITHALEAAHECGVVHRDLKPENVFLATVRGRQTVKLLDFGIAKLIGGRRDRAKWTEPGQLLGTPLYMSPEQVRGTAIDGRCDTYSLGVMLFEMLTGTTPFTAKTPLQLAALHATKVAPSPSQHAADVPADADALVMAMLDKAPGRRPSLAEVRARLMALVQPVASVATGAARAFTRRPDATPPGGYRAVSRAASREDLGSTGALLAAATPARRWKLPALGAVAAAVVAIAWVHGIGRRGEDLAAREPRVEAPVRAAAPVHVASIGTATHEAPPPEPISPMRALELSTQHPPAARPTPVAAHAAPRSTRAPGPSSAAAPVAPSPAVAPPEVATDTGPRHLVVEVRGGGNLTGSMNGASIRCAAAAQSCDLGSLAYATQVTLQAIPQPGFHLAGWTNCLGDDECRFTLDEDVTVIARFAPDEE